MNNELSQVGDWWILIRNLTHHQPPAFVLAALEGMLRTSCTSLCSPPLGDCSATEGASCEMQPPRLGTTLLLLSDRWKDRECASKNDGKRRLSGHLTPSWDYQQVWWIVFSLSIVNRSWHFFFLLLFFFLMTVSILLSEMSWWSAWSYKGGRENINLHLLSPAELSSVILSGLAGEGQ